MTYEEMDKELTYCEVNRTWGDLPFGSKMFEFEIKDLKKGEQERLRERYDGMHRFFEMDYVFMMAQGDLSRGNFESFYERLKEIEKMGKSYIEAKRKTFQA